MNRHFSADNSLPPWIVQSNGYGRPEPDLFPEDLHTALAGIQVSLDEARRWHERGWFPFALDDQLHPLAVNHLRFVRDVVRSGLEDAQVAHLMGRLPKGILTGPERTTYSFSYGWVEATQQEAETLDLDEAIDQLAENEDWDRLRELRDQIDCCLEDEPVEESAE